MNDRTPPPWVEGLTIGQMLAQTADRYPQREALFFAATRFQANYREFLRLVDEAAQGLWALGIRSGEHVALWATNVPQWVILQFATARIGAVLVTINPAYRPFELQYVLQQSDAVASVSGRPVQVVRLFCHAGRSLPGTGR